MGGACRGSNTGRRSGGSGDLNLASAHAHADNRVAEGGRVPNGGCGTPKGVGVSVTQILMGDCWNLALAH